MPTFHNAKRSSAGTKIALVDIDETICFYEGPRRYDLAIPNLDNIKKINDLFNLGWKITYWTSRGGTSGIDYYEYTLDQLKGWGCQFTDLICGKDKPFFDCVIDDKAKRIEEL